jgi:predicted nucleic-acid-binding Zn-ribbon protein
METKTCLKCGGEMASDKNLGSYTELMLRNKDQYVGDRIQTFYCIKCGYIELYREKKRSGF